MPNTDRKIDFRGPLERPETVEKTKVYPFIRRPIRQKVVEDTELQKYRIFEIKAVIKK